MANIFGSHGLTDSLLDAVRDVQSKSDGVSKHAAFGYVTEKKKMDPVGDADADIDNDGDVDKSDKYLHNRRKAVKKAMGGKKDEVDVNPKDDNVKEDADDTKKILDRYKKELDSYKKDIKKQIAPKPKNEATGVDDKAVDPHNCATHVYSEQWGDGTPVKTMHADPDEAGNIAWYDVMFEHGVEKRVSIEELKVIKSSHHGHKKRGMK